MIDWTAQILLKWKGIDDLIYAVDQGVDGWDRPVRWRRSERRRTLAAKAVRRSQAYLVLHGTVFDED
jgi:hypothetical protein